MPVCSAASATRIKPTQQRLRCLQIGLGDMARKKKTNIHKSTTDSERSSFVEFKVH